MYAPRNQRDRLPIRFRDPVASRGVLGPLLLGLLVFSLCGCGAIKSVVDGATENESASGSSEAKDLAPDSQPRWGATGETQGLDEHDPVLVAYSQDLTELRGQVAARCGGARVNAEPDFLAPLVTDLYRSGVDPADATEALIRGDCGPLASIVQELVAQGGDQAVAAVVPRALSLSGPGTEPIVESAASSGLERNLAAFGARPGIETGSVSYSMAYFSSRGESPGLETADAVNTLYSNGKPGYGVYTYVLLGTGRDASGEAERVPYSELLRVIDTYVLAGEGPGGPSPEAHAFLVAVHPERSGAALAEQTGPELSGPVRRNFERYLRLEGQAALAQRLETRPGPFLISSPEPRLLPSRADSPRLVADLSTVGSEYMYGVVDAYDRPVTPGLSGRPESLVPIRQRLLRLLDGGTRVEHASKKGAWVFWLGPQIVAAEAQAMPALGVSSKAPTAGVSVPVNADGASAEVPPS